MHKSFQCRACGAAFRGEPLLHYGGMPAGAQNFPTAEMLAEDRPVDLEIVQCPCCGVVQHTSPAVPYWQDVIRAVGFSAEMRAFRLQQFTNFIQKFSLIGKTGLEFGCGDGAYLALLAQAGCNAFGVEHSAQNVAACHSKGLQARQGFPRAEGRLFDMPADAFFIFSYLEHIPQLRDYLEAVRANLKDGAVGIIEVPNFDMILEQNLFAEFIVDHIFYFTKESLTRTLENNGFTVLRCDSVWHGYILSAEIALRPAVDISNLAAAKNGSVASVVNFLKKFDRVAVWGAGHQSFTLLAMLGHMPQIKYIVDSAPFKQGRFSPVTHIPVVAPQALCSDPVDAVVVIGGSYSDEIAETAQSAYAQQNIVIYRNNAVVKYQR